MVHLVGFDCIHRGRGSSHGGLVGVGIQLDEFLSPGNVIF